MQVTYSQTVSARAFTVFFYPAVECSVIKVEITNKAKVLYYYQKWVYDQYQHHVKVVPSSLNLPSGRSVVWSINSDLTGGTSIDPNTGALALTDTPGTFVIRATDSLLPTCFDEQKCMIINVNDLKSPPAISEVSVLASHPGYLALGLEADAWSSAQTSLSDTERDAAKHMYWQALITADARFGQANAKEWGDAHEYRSGGGSGLSQAGYSNPQNNGMDLHNNVIGRFWGSQYTMGAAWSDPLSSVAVSILRTKALNAVASSVDPVVVLNPEVPNATLRCDTPVTLP